MTARVKPPYVPIMCVSMKKWDILDSRHIMWIKYRMEQSGISLSLWVYKDIPHPQSFKIRGVNRFSQGAPITEPNILPEVDGSSVTNNPPSSLPQHWLGNTNTPPHKAWVVALWGTQEIPLREVFGFEETSYKRSVVGQEVPTLFTQQRKVESMEILETEPTMFLPHSKFIPRHPPDTFSGLPFIPHQNEFIIFWSSSQVEWGKRNTLMQYDGIA